MSADKDHSVDLIQYIEGKMSSGEAHAFERAALDDPFLFEAIEGAETISPEEFQADLATLDAGISIKNSKSSLWRVAASIAILAIAGLSIWFINQGIKPQEIAQNDSSQSPSLIDHNNTNETIGDSSNVEDIKIATQEIVEIEPLELAPVAMAEVPMDKQSQEIKRKELINTSPASSKMSYSSFDDQKFEPDGMADDSMLDQTDNFAVLEENEVIKKEDLAAFATKKTARSRTKSFMKATGAVSRSGSRKEPIRILFGRVTDDFGIPLPDVNVIAFGKVKGAVTDLSGNYSLDSISDNTMLNFSSIGMPSQDIVVGVRDTLDVKLDEDAQSLQEVVVMGYGVSDEPTKGFNSASPIPDFKSFNAYIEENLVYPEEAISKGLEGRIVLQLTISPIGTITDIEVKRGLGAGCDEEAIRLIRQGPRWIPATRDGRNMESSIRVRMKFEIE